MNRSSACVLAATLSFMMPSAASAQSQPKTKDPAKPVTIIKIKTPFKITAHIPKKTPAKRRVGTFPASIEDLVFKAECAPSLCGKKDKPSSQKALQKAGEHAASAGTVLDGSKGGPASRSAVEVPEGSSLPDPHKR
jgi:hypothetical protein